MLVYVLFGISLLANVWCVAIIASLEKQLDDLSDKLFEERAVLDPVNCTLWDDEYYGEE